jgi:hypothetical protein
MNSVQMSSPVELMNEVQMSSLLNSVQIIIPIQLTPLLKVTSPQERNQKYEETHERGLQMLVAAAATALIAISQL